MTDEKKKGRAERWCDLPEWTHNVAVEGLTVARENNRTAIACHPDLAPRFRGFIREANRAIRVLRAMRKPRRRRSRCT